MTTEEFHRKLTAILSADVQGYSRLMEEDEDSTIHTLTAYRALMTSLIQSHRGHVVDTPGDNLLAEFGSVMDAVRCAVEIQEELRIRNADLPDNRKMHFRIGINLGDIIEDGDHIYGDGINIAARVEGMAEGGGICISGTVYDAIRNKLSMSYEFMGEHVVKNIKEMVRIYRIRVEPEAESAIKKEKKAWFRRWQWAALSVVAILVLGAVAYIVFDKYYLDRGAVEKEITTTEPEQVPAVIDVEEAVKTIAVLPFVDISPEKDQEYFVDGLSEELLNSLTQIPDLRVTARTSSFLFKDSDKSIQEIASILGVENILEGSVRKAGNALRITAQLVRTKDGFHLWSKTYNRELKDIFAVQEDIATAVANELKMTLGIDRSLRILGGTDNPEAYEHYLVAKGLQMQGGSLERALESLDAALVLDPEFALAWTMKATFHNLSSFVDDSALDAAQRAALKAIELEPNLPEAYSALGGTKLEKNEWIDAELSFRKARELTTEIISGDAYHMLLLRVGHLKRAFESIEEQRQINTFSPIIRGLYINGLCFLGDMKRAEEEAGRCIALFGDQFIDWQLTKLQFGAGDSMPLNEILPRLPIDDEAKERIKSTEEALEELHRFYTNNDNLDIFQFGEITRWAAYFGDPEFSMDVIEQFSKIDYFIWYPIMHEVRQSPRFKEFIREIGVVDYWNKFGWPDLCHPLDNVDFECD